MNSFETKKSHETRTPNPESSIESPSQEEPSLVDVDKKLAKSNVWFVFIKELTQIVVPAFILALIVYTFLAQATVVYGQSMEPTLLQNQRLVVDKLSYRFQEPVRGDIIVVRLPGMREMLVKRVIALPGEVIEIQGGVVYINGVVLDESQLLHSDLSDVTTESPDTATPTSNNQITADPEIHGTTMPDVIFEVLPMTIEPGDYFVMGDNRVNSNDSRSFGPVSRQHILGRVWFRYWPLTQFGSF